MTRREPLYRRALAGEEEALGPAHPARWATGSATVGSSGGSCSQRAGQVRRGGAAVPPRACGPGGGARAGAPGDAHASVGNLAMLLIKQGKYDEAEPLYRRSLAGYEEAYGPAHPETLARWAIWRSCLLSRASTTRRSRSFAARCCG